MSNIASENYRVGLWIDNRETSYRWEWDSLAWPREELDLGTDQDLDP